MSQHKSHQIRPPLYNGDSKGRSRSGVAAGSNGQSHNEQQGWDAYRKWLSRVTTQPAQRTPVDSSIYSWKGYNNWAEKVRQTWKSEEPSES